MGYTFLVTFIKKPQASSRGMAAGDALRPELPCNSKLLNKKRR
jgi:hypothetical protein